MELIEEALLLPTAQQKTALCSLWYHFLSLYRKLMINQPLSLLLLVRSQRNIWECSEVVMGHITVKR